MSEILHSLLKDGSFRHEEFTKSAWERRDEDVVQKWSHASGDCHDPVERFLAKRGVAKEILVQSIQNLPPPQGAVFWPPCGELTVELLREMTTLCIEDARLFLRKKWPELPPSNPGPLANKKGQYLLFS